MTGESATQRVRAIVTRHFESIARGELRTVIDRTFPLAEAGPAHAYVEARKSFGRVVLIP